MYWLILGFVIISAVIICLPQKMSFVMVNDPKLTGKKMTHYTLLLLPILVLAWLLVTLFNGSNTHFGATAISFVLSACALALPKLHKLILPCAILTAICFFIESMF